MTIAAPGIMPEAVADLSVTDGLLTVSTTTLQGPAVLEIVVNDPDVSSTLNDIANGPSVNIQGVSYDLTQGSNGKWYAYAVDNSVSELMDGDGNGMEFGADCASGIGVKANRGAATTGSFDINTNDVWVNAMQAFTSAALDDLPGGCQDVDGSGVVSAAGVGGQADTATTTARQLLTDAVLQNAPSLSNHDDSAVDAAAADLGQRGHHLNATSGLGSWPFILKIEMQSNVLVEYGSDAIAVSYGNTGDYTSIGVNNTTVADETQIHLWITDPGLNIDPTTADIWEYDTTQTSTFIFANNGTNSAFTQAETGQMGCVDNCFLSIDDASTDPSELTGFNDVVMTESGANTGLFESYSADGTSEVTTVEGATIDTQHIFKYNGDSVDIVIAYADAEVSMTAPGAGDWLPATSATIEVNDPDLNKNPLSAEVLEIGNSTHTIPTIKLGSPLTLAVTNDNTSLSKADANSNTGVTVGHDKGSEEYTLKVFNTTDNSDRLRIIHSVADDGIGANTHTWINVTTGHTRTTLVDLPGTTVLNYDVSGPAALLDSTAVEVYVTDSGNNATKNIAGLIKAVTSGNARTGVVDLDASDQSGGLANSLGKNTSVTALDDFTDSALAGTTFISVAFKITHAAGDKLLATEDYAIAADFCNFDQNNGSLVHNCI
jgi:hypothetical protein